MRILPVSLFFMFFFSFYYGVLFNCVSAQIINTYAGDGQGGFSGNGGPATDAEIFTEKIAIDKTGNLFITDESIVRMVNTSGIISTVIGNGDFGYSGDGGPATMAEMGDVFGIAIDDSGKIYLADNYYNKIRMVNTGGIISTLAGNGTRGFAGDGGPADSAEFFWPEGMAADKFGNVFVDDYGNGRIRMINTSGIISTFAGNGGNGFSGDGGPATSAELSTPLDIAFDQYGNLYICCGTIRMVNPSGIISTVAGIPTSGYSGDWGPATSAELYTPESVAIDKFGNIYIADNTNERIRMVDWSGIITTITGNGFTGYWGDGGSSYAAGINDPYSVAVDSTGNVYISDLNNRRVREITNIPTTVPSLSNFAEANIYPNPNKGSFTISINAKPETSNDRTIEVYNISGERVALLSQKGTEPTALINLSFQPNGIYFYRVMDGGENEIAKGKFIIQN